ncbi:CYTH domain-containing protein [candidate division KSB3 bacterium]|nr:CYTH domain-containing protein [candidate division KSB3 bacterium]
MCCGIMAHEVEAKYPVENLSRVQRALRSAGAEFRGTFLQSDCFYDLPDHTYRKNGCGLRLRSLKILKSGAVKLDPRPEITFKGPVKPNAKVKIRREIQTRLDCGKTAHQLMLACGLKQVMCVEKRRSSYRLGRCLVELDQLPMLGTFVEIEGPDEKTIEGVRQQLKIDSEHISASYLHLLAEHCKNKNLQADIITFERFGD